MEMESSQQRQRQRQRSSSSCSGTDESDRSAAHWPLASERASERFGPCLAEHFNISVFRSSRDEKRGNPNRSLFLFPGNGDGGRQDRSGDGYDGEQKTNFETTRTEDPRRKTVL